MTTLKFVDIQRRQTVRKGTIHNARFKFPETVIIGYPRMMCSVQKCKKPLILEQNFLCASQTRMAILCSNRLAQLRLRKILPEDLQPVFQTPRVPYMFSSGLNIPNAIDFVKKVLKFGQ
jgi:hypothetical protein